MDNLTLSAIIKNNIGLKNLERSGEVWDDITNEFTPNSRDNGYRLSNGNMLELIGNTPLRITIEISTFLESYTPVKNNITGVIQLYVTVKSYEETILSTNTIYLADTQTFSGRFEIRENTLLSYNYGVTIPEVDERPKILKVERLTGVN